MHLQWYLCEDVLRLPISEGCLAVMWKAEDKYSRDSIMVRNEALCGLSTLPGYDHGQLLSYYQGYSEASLAAVADLIYHLHSRLQWNFYRIRAYVETYILLLRLTPCENLAPTHALLRIPIWNKHTKKSADCFIALYSYRFLYTFIYFYQDL